jgi:predicted lipoprotein with Yx(FWY)xxD motif
MHIRPLLVLLAAGTVTLAACGSDNSSTSSGATVAPAASATTAAAATTATTAASGYGGGYATPTTTAKPAAATTAAPAATGATAITLADSSLGKVIVDSNGLTLYAFLKDTAGTPTCAGACATAWPAAIATGTPTAGAGITGALTTVALPDGSKQLKLGDWPLYRFSGDAAKGDTNGQGTGTLWYVVGADGKPIK